MILKLHHIHVIIVTRYRCLSLLIKSTHFRAPLQPVKKMRYNRTPRKIYVLKLRAQENEGERE